MNTVFIQLTYNVGLCYFQDSLGLYLAQVYLENFARILCRLPENCPDQHPSETEGNQFRTKIRSSKMNIDSHLNSNCWTLGFLVLTLTLWMLGNFLKKEDNIVVCFLKPVNSACFLWVMIDWVANKLDLRPAAELLGGWPGSNLFA